MSRLPAIFALSGLLAVIALVALPVSSLADEVDDYYEDEYGEEESDGETDDGEPEEPEVELPPRLKYARSGFYMYAGGAFVLSDLPKELNASNTGAFNLKVGARFRQYFAAEFEYQTVPRWDFTFEPVSGSDAGPSPALKTVQTVDVHSLSVNAKAYYPMARFQPFLQLGVGLAMTDEPGNEFDTGFETRFGAGLEYFWTDNVAVAMTAVYTIPFGKLDGFDYTSFVASVGYHF